MDFSEIESLIDQWISIMKKVQWIFVCNAIDFRVYNIIEFFNFKIYRFDSALFQFFLFSFKMINDHEYLLYLPEQQILIYQSCQYYLQSNDIKKHYNNSPNYIRIIIYIDLLRRPQLSFFYIFTLFFTLLIRIINQTHCNWCLERGNISYHLSIDFTRYCHDLILLQNEIPCFQQ
jgi:hypothetical protein